MRVLGIDPGTAIVGYGIVDVKGNSLYSVGYGCIYTDKDQRVEQRLLDIYKNLEKIIDLYKPNAIAVEELFFNKNVKTALSVGQSRGVVMLLAALKDIEIYSYTPLQVKQGVVGYGRATKQQVQEMVKNILGFNEIPRPDDAADGLAIAITHTSVIINNYIFKV